MSDLRALLAERARLPEPADLGALAVAVSRIPYGRPDELAARGVLQSWRGTCSTKHVLLGEIVEQTWPDLDPQLWHRVHLVSPASARARWGDRVAEVVPPEGLVDVHTYLMVRTDGSASGGPIVVDVTFPIDQWDAAASLPLACGEGFDHEAGPEPLESKRRLVAANCEPAVREPFIAALARMS